MFDSINMSSNDENVSQDYLGEDSGFVYSSELPYAEEYPCSDDTSFETESSIGGEISPPCPSLNEHDFAPWSTEENFAGESINLHKSHELSTETIDMSGLENEITFKASGGYTQGEINNHIADAKHDIADAESDIRHHTYIANSKARMGEPHSYEDSQIRLAQTRLEKARDELYKWQHTKPSK